MNRPTLLRLVFGCSLLICWFAGHVWREGVTSLQQEVGLARILPIDWLLTLPGWGVFTLVFFVALWGFVFRLREMAAAWTLMACMGILVAFELSMRNNSMPHLHVVLFGALLGSWLAARTWAKRRGMSLHERETLGHEAMAGTFGAMLMLASGSKLVLSGLDWFHGGAQCAVMFEHALLVPDNLFTPIREAASKQSLFCSLGAMNAVGVEALGVLMIWPSLRKLYAVLVVFLFVSLLVLYGMFEPGWPLVACALAWSRMEPSPSATERD